MVKNKSSKHLTLKTIFTAALELLLFACLFWLGGFHGVLDEVDGHDARDAVDPQEKVGIPEDRPIPVPLEQGERHKAVGQQEGHVQPAEGGGQRRGLEPPAERRLAQGGQELREREYNSFLCND